MAINDCSHTEISEQPVPGAPRFVYVATLARLSHTELHLLPALKFLLAVSISSRFLQAPAADPAGPARAGMSARGFVMLGYK